MKVSTNKIVFITVITVLILFWGLFAIELLQKDQSINEITSETPFITIETQDKNKLTINVEIAKTGAERSKGLMFRTELDENAGMIFIFEQEDRYGFWMKNTLIPLDMIHINKDKLIVDIIKNVPPCVADPCPSYTPNERSLYVLEVNSGYSETNNVNIGDSIEFTLS